MIAKKILGTVLAMSVVVSSALGGGVDGFANSSAVFAAGEDSDTLSAGTYTFPLVQQWSEAKTEVRSINQLHFFAQGILNVDDEGNQSLTIGVENWSLYDAFIPREQGYFNEEYRYLPSDIFNSENTNNITNFSYSDYEAIIDTNNSKYKISSADTKYGDITVDYETNKDIDVAYVTFDLEDYRTSFSFSAWLNTPFWGYNETIENASLSTNSAPFADYYWANITFHLDTAGISDVSEICNGNSTDLSYRIDIGASRKKSGALVNRTAIGYPASNATKSVFDSSIIEFNTNGTYTGKYHINPNGFKNLMGKVNYYSDFKLLTSVKHPTDNRESITTDEWDLLMSGTFSELEIDNEGYITVVYNSLQEALIGKYIFFDVGSTTDANVYFCIPCVTSNPIKDLIIRDEMTDSGIYIVTDTSKYPETAKLKVEKNKEINYYFNGELFPLSKRYNGVLYKNPEWYTITIVDENDNQLADKDVEIYFPLNGKYSEFIYKNNIACNSENVVFKKQSTDSEFHLTTKLVPLEVNGLTITFVDVALMSNVHDITEDGIYTANAVFIKHDTDNTTSMADNGLIRKAYIEVKDGKKKLYFKSGIVTEGCYIGEVYCDDISAANKVYEDSIKYTDYEVVDGEIASNTEFYDAYTEYANVKGGILDLMDECYNADDNYYAIALVAPVMQCLTGAVDKPSTLSAEYGII